MAPYGITDEMHRTGIKVPRWQHRDRTGGVIAEWDLSLHRRRDAVPVSLPPRAAPAHADPLRPPDAASARRGALRRARRRRRAGRGSGVGLGRDRRRRRALRGRVARRRRRRPQRRAEGDRRRVRGVHLAGALRRRQHALRLRRARLHAQRLRRRPGSVGGGLQDAGRRARRAVAHRVSGSAGRAGRGHAVRSARSSGGCSTSFRAPSATRSATRASTRCISGWRRSSGGAGAARRRRGAPQQPARRVRPERRHPRRDQPRRASSATCVAAKPTKRSSTGTCASGGR